MTFAQLKLHPEILKGIRDLGFTTPTPIQARAIPPILEGRDLIGAAQTGTGKTAAFLLPIIHRLLQRPGRGNVRALIVAPTRELALQSAEHLKGFSKHVHLKGAAIFGGVPMEYQIQALERGLDIVSATPGRLLDHIYSGRIDFVDLEVFVLDEVDRMLDMGFLPDINKIIELLPPERQNLVFSATVPEEIRKLVHEILRDPVTIEIAPETRTAVGITQAVYPVPRPRKIDLLVALFKQQQMKSVLVFTRTKVFATRLAQSLERRHLRVSLIHGDRTQSQRLRALDLFRRGRNQVMVATEIAARGLDIDDISHVINFDVPESPDAYVHRIGRTARAGATGDAFTLMAEDEEPLVHDIEKTLGKQLPRVILPEFSYDAGRSTHDHGHHRSTHGSPRGHGPSRTSPAHHPRGHAPHGRPHPQGHSGHRRPKR